MTFSVRMTLILLWVELALIGTLTEEKGEETSLIYGVKKREVEDDEED